MTNFSEPSQANSQAITDSLRKFLYYFTVETTSLEDKDNKSTVFSKIKMTTEEELEVIAKNISVKQKTIADDDAEVDETTQERKLKNLKLLIDGNITS